jgi:hypothetical protein
MGESVFIASNEEIWSTMMTDVHGSFSLFLAFTWLLLSFHLTTIVIVFWSSIAIGDYHLVFPSAMVDWLYNVIPSIIGLVFYHRPVLVRFDYYCYLLLIFRSLLVTTTIVFSIRYGLIYRNFIHYGIDFTTNFSSLHFALTFSIRSILLIIPNCTSIHYGLKFYCIPSNLDPTIPNKTECIHHHRHILASHFHSTFFCSLSMHYATGWSRR